MDFYVSPAGNDTWSGKLPEPNAQKTDGPLATLTAARNRLRTLTKPPMYYNAAWTPQGVPGPITVHLRGGRYFLPEPLVLKPEDSLPVTYAAYADEKPILDGGKLITGWHIEPVNGRTAWVVDLPEVASGDWYFRSLFVHGQRRLRPRLPKEGFYRLVGSPRPAPSAHLMHGSDSFVCQPGHIQRWKNLTDVEAVVLHLWVDEHMPLVSYDETSQLVQCSRRSIFTLAAKDKYYLENVFEALTEPGQWYLDRPTGRLYYIPLPGEDPETTEVFAPRLTQLLKLAGRPQEGRYVQFVRFRNLIFQHTDAVLPPGGFDVESMGVDPPPGPPADFETADYASGPQAACHIPGVISFAGADRCAIEHCTIEHVGWYAVELAEGCTANRIVGNAMTDLGAGGVRLNGAGSSGPSACRTGRNIVTDNHIHHAGRVFHQGAGVFSQHSFGNVIAHNHIHDLYYSGISVGWIWGFAENVSKHNIIEKNHIHHLGFGWLSDMGGIYTLGVQPGTVIGGNVIHDIVSAEYGGWAIYLDEGSSHIVVENNLGYHTGSEVFHHHFGYENIVRNNIFAFGHDGIVKLSRTDATTAFTFTHNILVADGQPLYVGGYGHKLEKRNPILDLNLLWDVSGKLTLGRNEDKTKLDLDRWHSIGNDRHSRVADPLFRDIQQLDFEMTPDSPALQLGVKPIDASDVGPRPGQSNEVGDSL